MRRTMEMRKEYAGVCMCCRMLCVSMLKLHRIRDSV